MHSVRFLRSLAAVLAMTLLATCPAGASHPLSGPKGALVTFTSTQAPLSHRRSGALDPRSVHSVRRGW
jgi:hypothetical protein